MFTEPRLTPVTVGCTAGVVCPAAIRTDVAESVSLDESLLVRVTVTPPAGAADGNEIGNDTVWPSPTLVIAGS